MNRLEGFLGRLSNKLDTLSRKQEVFVQINGENWTKAAKLGWYLGPKVPLRATMDINWDEDPDSQILEGVSRNYREIRDQLLSNHENRKHILESAFTLHESENYIASIPLFLSQADGIFEELVSKNDQGFFGRSKKKVKRAQIIENLKKELESGEFIVSLAYFENDIDCRSSATQDSFNRNGIMHGLLDFMDYGTRVNSFKAMLVTSYVSWISEILTVKRI